MAERNDLLTSIVETTADYREGDLAVPTPEHVECWIDQFKTPVQLPILREMDYVLKQTYFSRKKTGMFLSRLFKTKKLVGDDPCAFWMGTKFLDIQDSGDSQKEMLELFSRLLSKNCGVEVADCGKEPYAFVYLDDASFTGNRVRRDLEDWITNDAPLEAEVHIITIALHSGGQYYAKGKAEEAARKAEKKIELNWWRAIELEDRRTCTNSSDVLRPVIIPEDEAVHAYVAAMSHKPVLRRGGSVGNNSVFSSNTGRQLLEEEFLKAGVRIRQMCANLGKTQCPLGNTFLETLGFGSLIVTFRNCPNNAPLALWAGEPWYPLFQRATNSTTSIKRHFMVLPTQENF